MAAQRAHQRTTFRQIPCADAPCPARDRRGAGSRASPGSRRTRASAPTACRDRRSRPSAAPIWLTSGMPASARRAIAARPAGVNSRGWLAWSASQVGQRLRLQRRDHLRVDPLRRDERHARMPAQNFDVPDRGDLRGRSRQPARREHQRVAAGDHDLPDLRPFRDIGKRRRERRRPRDAPAGPDRRSRGGSRSGSRPGRYWRASGAPGRDSDAPDPAPPRARRRRSDRRAPRAGGRARRRREGIAARSDRAGSSASISSGHCRA